LHFAAAEVDIKFALERNVRESQFQVLKFQPYSPASVDGSFQRLLGDVRDWLPGFVLACVVLPPVFRDSLFVFSQLGSQSQSHHLRGLRLGDDRHAGKSLSIGRVAVIVILMPVRIQHVTNGLIRPLADLRDVFASR
jgi:hypothetical protein